MCQFFWESSSLPLSLFFQPTFTCLTSLTLQKKREFFLQINKFPSFLSFLSFWFIFRRKASTHVGLTWSSVSCKYQVVVDSWGVELLPLNIWMWPRRLKNNKRTEWFSSEEYEGKNYNRNIYSERESNQLLSYRLYWFVMKEAFQWMFIGFKVHLFNINECVLIQVTVKLEMNTALFLFSHKPHNGYFLLNPVFALTRFEKKERTEQ